MTQESEVRPPAPEATIQLDRSRVLRADFDAFRLVKKSTGISLLSGAVVPADEELIPAFIWAFLFHEDETLTPEVVSKSLTLATVVSALETIMHLVQEALPDPKEVEDGESEDPLREAPDAA